MSGWKFDLNVPPHLPNGINNNTWPLAIIERLESIHSLLERLLEKGEEN